MSEHGQVEIRSATITAVDYPKRELSLIVVPYDEWTAVAHRGQLVEESVAPGAFGAIRNRARKFLVNMEHDLERWVGTVLDLEPDDPAGLRATVKIRRSAEGDQALDDAADELLGASIGMAVSPGDQTWETRTRRRITKAYLDHVALTATPAYVGAKVLEVRTAAGIDLLPVSATPNLDAILAERYARGYSSLLT
jgi:HK97 family phage prohead protease